MKQASNKDMLNAIRNQASEEYKANIPSVVDGIEGRTARHIWDKLENYPSLKNEFINTLATKVVRTDFFSKVYENPWKMFKKGTLQYGHSIEESFVHAAEAKGFFENQDVSMNDVKELVGVTTPVVDQLYISRNFAYVFKTSISDSQLKSAFFSQNGLSELVNQIVGSLTNGAEQKEFLDMKALLFNIAEGKRTVMALESSQHVGDTTTENIQSGDSSAKGVKQYMYTEKLDLIKDGNEADYKRLTTKIRELAGQLKFVSDKYNMAGVKTWSRPEDLVFITTPKILANLDVNVLADAFNVSKAELNIRTVLVDSLPNKARKMNHLKPNGAPDLEAAVGTNLDSSATVYGYLVDKDFMQIFDTLNETRTFDNGRNLTQNLFLHKQGILANCFFANAICLATVAG